jgi:N-acetylglutamate synthase
MRDIRRLEELGLNSSAPPGQLLYDGWLLRLLPGKAKRARSVNAVYASTRPLKEKITYCERVYREAGLPAIFRITPFSHPPGLDGQLERHGYERFETTAVEAAALDAAHFESARFNTGQVELLDLPAWVEVVGKLRESSKAHRTAHLARLQGLPLAMRAVAVSEGGRVLATGLTVVEDGCAGLFDIVTDAQVRRKGFARQIVASLMRIGWDLGARQAYLQVKSDNAPARRLYAQFGFQERYQYWYRGRPGDQE